jgi:hypothetical protein
MKKFFEKKAEFIFDFFPRMVSARQHHLRRRLCLRKRLRATLFSSFPSIRKLKLAVLFAS